MELIEDKHYVDNHFTIDNGIVDIDRVYMVEEDEFTKKDYEKLDLIYKQLPCFIGYHGCPNWFGLDNDEIFLTVSFEPSGLQLMGNLKQNDFEEWEKNFHTLMAKADFPYKYV